MSNLTKVRREQIIKSVVDSTFIAAERKAITESALKALKDLVPQLPMEWVLTDAAPELCKILRADASSGPLQLAAEPVLRGQLSAARYLQHREDTLRRELEYFLTGCRTYKQVIEKMPELAPHLPRPTVQVYAPITSTAKLSASLASLGFDRTKEKA
jgi:hypothetical protein